LEGLSKLGPDSPDVTILWCRPVDRVGAIVSFTGNMMPFRLFRVWSLGAALGLGLAVFAVRGQDTAVADTRQAVVVLGDSLTAGYGLDPNEAYPALLQQKVDAAKLPYAVINAGVSGDTSAGGLRRVDWLLKRKVDVLLIELGGNDGLRGLPPEATKTNLQGIITKTRAKYPAAKIVLAGMKVPPNMGADYAARFEKSFVELARENQATLIPFLLEGVGGKPELNLPDRIHPTAEGHRLVAETVWRTLEPVLKGK
jgi:acyl-CoA thioesterase-1